MEKIFISDSYRVYARLIKLEFSNTFEIHCAQNYAHYSEIDFKQFSFAFVVIHDYEELVRIIPIIQTVPNIILGSKLKNIEEISQFSENIMLIDITLPKNQLLEELKSMFHLFSKEELFAHALKKI